jgi:hypothetical protein
VAKRAPVRHLYKDRVTDAALEQELRIRLAGAPADGSAASSTSSAQVIWVDAGDEVLVHLDSIQVRVLNRMIIVSIDLETDQTGRAPIIVPFALGGLRDQAGLIATTHELARGNRLLAARWGGVLQSALWAALTGLAKDHADERGQQGYAIHALPGRITLKSAVVPPVAVTGPVVVPVKDKR